MYAVFTAHAVYSFLYDKLPHLTTEPHAVVMHGLIYITRGAYYMVLFVPVCAKKCSWQAYFYGFSFAMWL